MAAGFEGGAAAAKVESGSRISSNGNGTAGNDSSVAQGTPRRHLPSKSVDLVRGQWEQKIQSADKTDDTPKASKRYTIMSPPSTSSSVFTEPKAMDSPIQSSSSLSRQPSFASSITSNSTTDSVLSRCREKAAAGGMSIDATSIAPIGTDEAIVPPSPALSFTSNSSYRPGSVASYHSVLSPNSTGASSQASGRSQAMEDTLAQARANALKRREERMKAQGKSTETAAPASAVERTAGGTVKAAPDEGRATDESKTPTLKAAPDGVPAALPKSKISSAASIFESARTPTSANKEAPATPARSTAPEEPKKGSPFAHLFTPPSASTVASTETTSTSSRSAEETPKSRQVRPPNQAARPADAASEYTAARAGLVPSGLGRGPPPSASASTKPSTGLGVARGLSVPGQGLAPGKDKYGSISSTDRRRLGRHLPRIASGGEGWEGIGDEDKERTARRVPSNLGLASAFAAQADGGDEDSDVIGKEGMSKVDKRRSVDILAPRPPSVASVASTASIFEPPLATPSVVSQKHNDSIAIPKDETPAPYTPNKRRSAYIEHLAQVQAQVNTPKVELQAGEMKGLIKAVGATPVRGGVKGRADEGEGVTGKYPAFPGGSHRVVYVCGVYGHSWDNDLATCSAAAHTYIRRSHY